MPKNEPNVVVNELGDICEILKDPSHSIDNELKLTTKLLKSSISNFSAWHYRSNLLKSKVEDDLERKSIIEKELDLIMNAIFTDPNDQSIWIYYKWIISKIKDIDHFGTSNEVTTLNFKSTLPSEL